MASFSALYQSLLLYCRSDFRICASIDGFFQFGFFDADRLLLGKLVYMI